MKKVKLEKLSESANPKHPNNIPVGEIHEGNFIDEPIIGECFWVGYNWRTSAVQEIITENIFRTYNSIYKWTVYED